MGEFLATKGYSVEGVLLARHDGPPAKQYGVDWHEWLESAEMALQRLQQRCARTVLIGFSMGGLLACHLAARYPTAGLVLLAPALRMRNEYQLKLAGVAQYPMPWLYPLWRADFSQPGVQDSVREFLPDADFSNPQTQEQLRRDVRLPTGALYELIRLQRVVKRNLWRIHTPLLVLQGQQDRTVQPVAAEIAMAKICSSDKTLRWFERSGHMLPNDIEREAVWSTAADWIAQRVPSR